MDVNLIFNIISMLIGGGLSALVTAKHVRRQAEADAMQHFQTVYQGLIKDLQEDRTNLREERNELAGQLKSMEVRFNELEDKVLKNSRLLTQLSTIAAAQGAKCKDCILIELINNPGI